MTRDNDHRSDADRRRAAGGTPAWLPAAAVAITLVLWASAFVGIRHVAETPPRRALAGRLLVAALGCLPLVLRRGSGCADRREWSAVPPAASRWFGIYNLALNEGERRVDAGTAA